MSSMAEQRCNTHSPLSHHTWLAPTWLFIFPARPNLNLCKRVLYMWGANCRKNGFPCGDKRVCHLWPLPRRLCDTYCLYVICGFRNSGFLEDYLSLLGRGLHFSSLRHITSYSTALARSSVIWMGGCVLCGSPCSHLQLVPCPGRESSTGKNVLSDSMPPNTPKHTASS